MIILTGFCSNSFLFADMQNSYNSGKAYQNKLQLGNPDNAASLINPQSNTENLQNLNDATLESEGRKELGLSKAGKFIQTKKMILMK